MNLLYQKLKPIKWVFPENEVDQINHIPIHQEQAFLLAFAMANPKSYFRRNGLQEQPCCELLI